MTKGSRATRNALFKLGNNHLRNIPSVISKKKNIQKQVLISRFSVYTICENLTTLNSFQRVLPNVLEKHEYLL